jgi:hypothetical protein
MSPPNTDRASTAMHTDAELRYVLNNLPDAMAARGVTIKAGAFEIKLLPGRLADRLADELSQGLRLDVMRREVQWLERAQQERGRQL